MRTARATAPTRVDLAGGTLDIWPLYCFLGGGLTLNAAIDLRAEATVASRPGSRVRVRSADLGEELLWSPGDERPGGSPLAFVWDVVDELGPPGEIDIELRSRVPRGSGLGGSSALLVALLGAMRAICWPELPDDELVQIAADIEARQIGVPTGKQDYWAALRGGLLEIRWGPGGGVPVDLTGGAAEVAESLVVLFTGESHFSATNNWAMLRRYVEDEGATRAQLAGIRDTAERMAAAFERRAGLEEVAALLLEEWENRKGLAPGVTTPQVERLIEVARETGALGWKLCGAGGGGSLLVLAPPERCGAVRAAARAAGAEPLDARLSTEGLAVEVDGP